MTNKEKEEDHDIIEFCRAYFQNVAEYCLSSGGDEAVMRPIEELGGIPEQAAHDFRIAICARAGAQAMLNCPHGTLKKDYPEIYEGVKAKLAQRNEQLADVPHLVSVALSGE